MGLQGAPPLRVTPQAHGGSAGASGRQVPVPARSRWAEPLRALSEGFLRALGGTVGGRVFDSAAEFNRPAAAAARHAIQQLETLDQDLLNRRDLERLFGVSKGRAVALMTAFGAGRTGHLLTLPRSCASSAGPGPGPPSAARKMPSGASSRSPRR